MIQKPSTTLLEAQPRSIASIVLAVIAIGLCVLVEGAIVISRFRFSSLIDEFELTVSGVTRFAIGPFFPVLLAIVILAAVIKEFVPVIRPAFDKCNLVILLIGLSCLAIYVIGVFALLTRLLKALP